MRSNPGYILKSFLPYLYQVILQVNLYLNISLQELFSNNFDFKKKLSMSQLNCVSQKVTKKYDIHKIETDFTYQNSREIPVMT